MFRTPQSQRTSDLGRDQIPAHGFVQRLRHGVETLITAPLTERLSRLSAVFSYYAIFSLIPLLLLTATVTGFTLGWEFANIRAATNAEQPTTFVRPATLTATVDATPPLDPQAAPISATPRVTADTMPPAPAETF